MRRKDHQLLYGEEGRRRVGKKGRRSDRRPRARHVLAKSGRWLFLFVPLGQNWLCVNQRRSRRTTGKNGDDGKVAAAGNPSEREQMEWFLLRLLLQQSGLCVSAAAGGPQKRTEAMEMLQQELQVDGGRWAEEIPQRWKRPKGEDRTEMKKDAKLLRCTLLNGSAWVVPPKQAPRGAGVLPSPSPSAPSGVMSSEDFSKCEKLVSPLKKESPQIVSRCFGKKCNPRKVAETGGWSC